MRYDLDGAPYNVMSTPSVASQLEMMQYQGFTLNDETQLKNTFHNIGCQQNNTHNQFNVFISVAKRYSKNNHLYWFDFINLKQMM